MVALYELMDMLPDVFVPSFTDRLNALYVFLHDQEEKLSEQEALKRFLGDTERSKYFNKLKNGLKREIIWYIVANPSVWVDAEYKALHQDCYRSFTAYKTLLLSGKRQAALEMAKALLPRLQDFELHGLIYIVATDLRFHFSSIEVSDFWANKYDEFCLQQMEILNAESIVRGYYSKMTRIGNTKESFSEADVQLFKKASLEVVPYLKLKSNYLNRFIYIVLISQYIAVFDYKNIIKYCDEALASFPPDHRNSIALKFTYMQMKLPALVAINKLRQAKELAKEACCMMPKGNFNWHLAFIRRITVCLHAQDYQEAYDLYKAHAQQKCPYPVLAEYWSIIWGYLYFLIQVGKIKEYSEERFHLGKLLNEVPIYAKDKTGSNINLLIIQIIIRMHREQYGSIIDRIEVLEAYARTYTRNKETVRANIFINMIIKMEKASFHRAGTERKTKQLFEKLQRTPLSLGQNLAIEIIPYEILWKEMLHMLDYKFRIKKKQGVNVQK